MTARETAAYALMSFGVLVELVCCLGLLVLHGPYDRLHLTGPTTLGAVAIAIAILVREGFSLIADWALVLAAFLLVTSPLLAHATLRAARVAERGDWRLGSDEDVEVQER